MNRMRRLERFFLAVVFFMGKNKFVLYILEQHLL